MRDDHLGWNAGGGCCGQPAMKQVDDVAYIQSAVNYLINKYAINRDHIYGIGHSNGAMMTQRLMCETSLYAAAVAVSGPLNVSVKSCPAARGKHIFALHGAEDQNVPIQGGQGTKGLSKAIYQSEAYSQNVFTHSGAIYDLQIIKNADHNFEHIDKIFYEHEGHSIAEKAVEWFDLYR
jgi:polyhydroxybutyrate depolymerase